MYTLLIQVLTLGALTLVELSRAYQVDGYGLAPWIALPVATLMICLPLAWTFTQWLHNEPVDDMDPRGLETAPEERTVYLSPTMSWPDK